MRHLVLVVTLALTLASSASAQDDQFVPPTIDPEVQSSTTAMSEMRSVPLGFVPAPSRRTVHPAELGEIKIAIVVQSMGPTNRFKRYYVTHYEPSALPAGTRVTKRLYQPDGVVVLLGETVVPPELDGWSLQGTLWNDVFPSSWDGKMATFEVEATPPSGLGSSASAKVPVNILPLPLVGLLEGAIGTPDGGVFLDGSFYSPVVVAPHFLGGLIPVEGGHFIPSSVGLEGEVVLGVCPEVTPRKRECSTRTLYLPMREAASRNR